MSALKIFINLTNYKGKSIMKTSAIKKLATCNGICYWVQVCSAFTISTALQLNLVYKIAVRAIEHYLHKDLWGMNQIIYSVTAHDCKVVAFSLLVMIIGFFMVMMRETRRSL